MSFWRPSCSLNAQKAVIRVNAQRAKLGGWRCEAVDLGRLLPAPTIPSVNLRASSASRAAKAMAAQRGQRFWASTRKQARLSSANRAVLAPMLRWGRAKRPSAPQSPRIFRLRNLGSTGQLSCSICRGPLATIPKQASPLQPALAAMGRIWRMMANMRD